MFLGISLFDLKFIINLVLDYKKKNAVDETAGEITQDPIFIKPM